jgi:hypothetical protein
MKKIAKGLVVSFLFAVGVSPVFAQAQKVDEARMERDIEVAENILNTLLRQQSERRYFFPMEVEGKYMPGYGVTFRLPGEMMGVWGALAPQAPLVVYNAKPGQAYSYSFSTTEGEDAEDAADRLAELEAENRELEEEMRKAEREVRREMEQRRRELEEEQRKLEEELRETRSRSHNVVRGSASGGRTGSTNRDSVSQAMNKKLIEVAKEFLVDYGDLIGQLSPEERIIVTNRGESGDMWFGFDQPKRSYLVVEAVRGDISQYKQGKLSREQMMAKLKVVNTTTSDKKEPDLELFSSIFERLYREDLSKTFFASGDIFFERLSDFGVVYYMSVYSAHDRGNRRFDMPTVNLENLTQEERDQKVRELYPLFEKGIKEDMLEYGRTVKSLKDNEVLSVHIKMTRCRQCGIPATLEYAVKADVLREYSSGKISKEAALAKVTLKKGTAQ